MHELIMYIVVNWAPGIFFFSVFCLIALMIVLDGLRDTINTRGWPRMYYKCHCHGEEK